jgi:peptidoglycan biosynthesis protein MviN/MurJ (putative lipid II flippase)
MQNYVDLDCVQYPGGGQIDWSSMEPINLGVAILTNALSIYMCIVALYWWYRLRESDTDFKGWFLGTAAVMLAVWSWTSTGIFQIVYMNVDLPLVTFPARIAFLVGIGIKVWKTTYTKSSLSNREKK